MADKDYVLIVEGRVQEHFHFTEADIAQHGDLRARFHPAFVGQCVDTTGLLFQPPQGWLWDEKLGRFALPLAEDGVTPTAPRVYGGEDLMQIAGGERMP